MTIAMDTWNDSTPESFEPPRSSDSHAQLRKLYMSLLEKQERFDEFKQLLALYPGKLDQDENDDAYAVRSRLNERISDWIGQDFDGLSASQTLLWRGIVVEERFNVQLSPWKESNAY